MKKLLILLTLLIMSINIFSQDIVYDSIQGNRLYWMRVKGGNLEDTTLHLVYENLGYLIQSKVLSAAGILDGMAAGVDYKDYTFNTDTLTYEFNTDVPINVIVYKYQYNDTLSRYFVGLRKANIGDNMFDGKYLMVSPLVVLESITTIYDGIGTNRKTVLILKPDELDDTDLKDYELSNMVTLKGINVSRVLRASKTDNLTIIDDNVVDNITIWPIPVENILNVQILNNKGVILRVYNFSSLLMYQQYTQEQLVQIDFSQYKPGTYILVIVDNLSGSILITYKIIKI